MKPKARKFLNPNDYNLPSGKNIRKQFQKTIRPKNKRKTQKKSLNATGRE